MTEVGHLLKDLSVVHKMVALVGNKRFSWQDDRGHSGVRRGLVAVFVATQSNSAANNLVTFSEYWALLIDVGHGQLVLYY